MGYSFSYIYLFVTIKIYMQIIPVALQLPVMTSPKNNLVIK
jgi:hypothetical protein